MGKANGKLKACAQAEVAESPMVAPSQKSASFIAWCFAIASWKQFAQVVTRIVIVVILAVSMILGTWAIATRLGFPVGAVVHTATATYAPVAGAAGLIAALGIIRVFLIIKRYGRSRHDSLRSGSPNNVSYLADHLPLQPATTAI